MALSRVVSEIFNVEKYRDFEIGQRSLKDHRQRIPKNSYKTIFRKINTEEIFSNLHSLQIKTIFQEKSSLRKFTVAVYVIYIYGRDVTHWCHL